MASVLVKCPEHGKVLVQPRDVSVVVKQDHAEAVTQCPQGHLFMSLVDNQQVAMLESVHCPVFRPQYGDTVTYSNQANGVTYEPRPDLHDREVQEAPAITRDELLDFHESLTDDAIAAWIGGEDG